MTIKLDWNKIITSIILALIIYVGKTVHDLEMEQKLMKYQLEQVYPVLQDLYEIVEKNKAISK